MKILKILLVPPPEDDIFPRSFQMRLLMLAVLALVVSYSYYFPFWMIGSRDQTLWRWSYPGVMPIGIIILTVFLGALYRWLKTGACGAMLLTFFMGFGLSQASSMAIAKVMRSLL